MNNVFVSHPGLQHSYQLAWGLYECGLLQGFWSGTPVLTDGEEPPFWLPSHYSQRLKHIGVSPSLRRHPIVFQVLLRAGAALPSGLSREDFAHRIFHLFDWWVSRHIAELKPKAVVAYENSAFHTFRAAKAIGALCILDAPSLHHLAGARLMQVKVTPYLQEINRRKDEEVALADLILTCSPLAAAGYLDAGVAPEKVQPLLLGATLPSGVGGWKPHALPLHFVFAGVLSMRKSIDIILAAFERLHAESLPYRLSFIGGQGEAGWVERIEETPQASYHPGVSQAKLYELLGRADCLLLPSRFDSFGMVVAEAMACGTPAVVSNQTGAKAMIEQYPGAGWIIDVTVEALVQCIRARIADRQELFNARSIAKQASREFTWSAYRARLGELISARL